MFDQIDAKPGSRHRRSRTALLCLALLALPAGAAATPDPRDLIRAAMDHWRGVTSYSEMTMIVHRADWERRLSMRAWTEGDALSLVRVTAPARDAGNATLVRDRNLWTFSPKINRVFKVPSSMLQQSWMGSDFSNRDISKSTEIIDRYEHKLLRSEADEAHRVHVVESIPREDAAVVWGREILFIRDDFVLLRHEFWDQDDILVKQMQALELAEMDGRVVARRLRMQRIESPQEWTELIIDAVDFDVDFPANLFTLSNLRNPRR